MLFNVSKELFYETKDARRIKEYYVKFQRVYKFTIKESEIFDAYPKICSFLYDKNKLRYSNIKDFNETRFSRWSYSSYNIKSSGAFCFGDKFENTSEMHKHKMLFLDHVVYPIIYEQMLLQNTDTARSMIKSIHNYDNLNGKSLSVQDIDFVVANGFSNLIGKGKAASIRKINEKRPFMGTQAFGIEKTVPRDSDNLEGSEVEFRLKTNWVKLLYDKPSHFHTERQIERVFSERLDDTVCNTFVKVLGSEFRTLEENAEEIGNFMQLASSARLANSDLQEVTKELQSTIDRIVQEDIAPEISKCFDKIVDQHFSEYSKGYDNTFVSPEFMDFEKGEQLLKGKIKDQMMSSFLEDIKESFEERISIKKKSVYNTYRPDVDRVAQFYRYLKKRKKHG